MGAVVLAIYASGALFPKDESDIPAAQVAVQPDVDAAPAPVAEASQPTEPSPIAPAPAADAGAAADAGTVAATPNVQRATQAGGCATSTREEGGRNPSLIWPLARHLALDTFVFAGQDFVSVLK